MVKKVFNAIDSYEFGSGPIFFGDIQGMKNLLTAVAGAALTFAAVDASAATLSANAFAVEAPGLTTETRANPAALIEERFSSVYSEGFEGFPLGEIDGIGGWSSTFSPNHAVDVFASEGAQALSIFHDGSGFEDLLFSPEFGDTGAGDFVSMYLEFAFTGGTSFVIATQSPFQGLVNTQILINADFSIDALVDDGMGGAEFVSTGASASADGFNSLELEVARADGSFTIDLNGVEIFSGLGFATLLEQIVFVSPNDGVPAFADIDNISVSNSSRVVPIPAAAPLFAAGMALAAIRRRKKTA
ncbi:MAG: VPLPA-CTERM sorting domain-containing protein [Pseudomonadota bacterium]